MEKRKHDYALDLLRFICALAVVMGHYEDQFDVHFSTLDFTTENFYYWIVNISGLFFIISGYLSYNSIDKIRNGLRFEKYYSGKLIRIVPVAAISRFFYGLMTYVTWRGKDFSVWKVLATAFLVQAGGPFTEMFVNSHLWYLSVLLLCYALFFIAIRLSRRFEINWRYACWFMVILGASAFNVTAWNNLPFIGIAASFGYMSFFTGVLLASVLENRGPNRIAVLMSLFILVSFSLLLIFRYEVMRYGMTYLMLFIYYPAIIVLIKSDVAQKLLNHKAFGFLGKITLGVYIWHMEFNILLSIADSVLHLGINFATRWAELVVILMNVAIGTGSFYLLEKPIHKALSRKLAERGI